MMNFLKPLQQALFFCFLAVLPVHAQEVEIQGVTQSGGNPVVETFDGEDLSTILGGQLRQTHNNSPWLVYLADGKLVMENRQNPNSLHYNDIAWVKYPSSTVVDTTQNAVISAVVEGRASSTGGVGILIGSGKAGAYIAFLVDQSGRYHLLQKDGRQLRTVITELNSAIRTDQPNELSFEVRGANLAFLVNGEDVIQIESPNRMPGSRRIDGRTGVGLAAFGIGTFDIESVEISKGN
jgi:hypothetical protein